MANNNANKDESDKFMMQSAPSIEIKINMDNSKVLNNYLNTVDEEKEEQK